MAAAAELTNAGAGGTNGLKALLDDPHPHVRCWAATHLLKIAPSAALPVLRSLAERGGMAGFNAEMVIKEWVKNRVRGGAGC